MGREEPELWSTKWGEDRGGWVWVSQGKEHREWSARTGRESAKEVRGRVKGGPRVGEDGREGVFGKGRGEWVR